MSDATNDMNRSQSVIIPLTLQLCSYCLTPIMENQTEYQIQIEMETTTHMCIDIYIYVCVYM